MKIITISISLKETFSKLKGQRFRQPEKGKG